MSDDLIDYSDAAYQVGAVWMKSADELPKTNDKSRFVSMRKCWGSSKKYGHPPSVSHECRFALQR